MPESILTNIPSITARRFIALNGKELRRTQQTLASGSIVTDPSNAPSNAAIAQRMETQTRGAGIASQNASQAESMLQLGAGTVANVIEQAQRMRALALTASNGLYTEQDVTLMNQEYGGLYAEISREIDTTLFNGVQILVPDFEAAIQVGPNTTSEDRIEFAAGSMDMRTIYNALSDSLDVTTLSNNLPIADELDTFINSSSTIIGEIGAQKAKMNVIVKNLAIFVENNVASKSIIADADIPEELAKAQSFQSLVDVSQTVLQNTAEAAKKLADLVKNGLR